MLLVICDISVVTGWNFDIGIRVFGLKYIPRDWDLQKGTKNISIGIYRSSKLRQVVYGVQDMTWIMTRR